MTRSVLLPMDSQFLEFWGNYLLAAAKGQKQLEDLNQWICQGFSGFEELTAMFKQFYGLEHPPDENLESAKAWENAVAGFRDSFNGYLDLMGVVPRDKYLALEQMIDSLPDRASQAESPVFQHLELAAQDSPAKVRITSQFADVYAGPNILWRLLSLNDHSTRRLLYSKITDISAA